MAEHALSKKEMKELFKVIATLKNATECKKFFRDIATLSELNAMAERWQVAKQINAKLPYRDIRKKTGSSTTTITRVAHWLHHGMGGYKLMLQRLGILNHR